MSEVGGGQVWWRETTWSFYKITALDSLFCFFGNRLGHSISLRHQKNDSSKPKILSVKSYSAVVIFCKGVGVYGRQQQLTPFPPCFLNDVLVVVVAQATTEFLIVHLWLILPNPPPPSHLDKIFKLRKMRLLIFNFWNTILDFLHIPLGQLFMNDGDQMEILVSPYTPHMPTVHSLLCNTHIKQRI